VNTSIPANLPLIRVDDVLIQEVFTNILENAAKYTPPGTAIEISAAESRENVVIFIRDNGAGFASGDEKHVFEKFFRGKTDGVRGAGLGLAICKAIVERHGGSITAANRPGGGAVITIELPIGGTPPVLTGLHENSPS
jgi:two-component system sensor histidine kinase KdpD